MSITIFVLFAVPRLSLKIGSLPIYAIDFLILFTAVFASRLRPFPFSAPFRPLVIFILILIVISELSAGIRIGTLLEPTYITGRMLIAGSLFFSVQRIIRTPKDLIPIIKSGLLGASITVILLIASSLPGTQNLVGKYIFSLPFLEPAHELAAVKYSTSLTVQRGRSLIGVSILSGAFLNTLWPLLMLLLIVRKQVIIDVKWRYALIFVFALIPFAIVMTYSRGAILGLFFAVFGVLIFYQGKAKRLVISVLGIAILVFYHIGWYSEYFSFARLEQRTRALIENPYEDKRETERLFAYTEPFEHLIKKPAFLVLGAGFARLKIKGHNLTDGYHAATHAVFAAAYYAYGMIAAFAIIILLLQNIKMTWRYLTNNKNRNQFSHQYSRALFAALLGFIPWFLFGHAAVSQPRGAMLMFFLFGLVATQKNILYMEFYRSLGSNSHHNNIPLISNNSFVI